MSSGIVIESPNKIKKIRQHTGSPVMATVGHFRDLPAKQLGVDLDTYMPTFEYLSTKGKVGDDLTRFARGKRIYIATDPDREGAAIAFHVFGVVRDVTDEIYRLEIHELTEKGIREAMDKAIPFGEFNVGLYKAFLGRRVGDRLIGYILSPIASRALEETFSVGRVQSPAVRLVVDREREIRDFVPEPYWNLVATFVKDSVPFEAVHKKGDIKRREKADALLETVRDISHGTVEKVRERRTKQKPKAPFTTVDLQSTAHSQLKMAPDTTMKLAQGLFEAGLITYHRTDSVRVADEIIHAIRAHVESAYGARYVPKRRHQYTSKSSQAEAHEAIRPTAIHPVTDCHDVVRREGLSEAHARLYELVVSRTMASQMAPAEYDSTTAELDVGGEVFKAKGRVLTFDGFLVIYKELEEEEDDDGAPGSDKPPAKRPAKGTGKEDQLLPPLVAGEEVEKTGAKLVQKKTKPPPRYNEGSLVKKLEALGIGRPSTYAAILNTIKTRGYVTVKRRRLYPTEKGEQLIDYLAETYAWILDYAFTAEMEAYLDRVQDNEADWRQFVKTLHERMHYYRPPRRSSDGTPSDKQLAFARSLTERYGEAPPDEALETSKELSRWISSVLEAHADEEQARPLSDRQRAVIERNADPETIAAVDRGDHAAGRRFLDEFFKKLPPRQ